MLPRRERAGRSAARPMMQHITRAATARGESERGAWPSAGHRRRKVVMPRLGHGETQSLAVHVADHTDEPHTPGDRPRPAVDLGCVTDVLLDSERIPGPAHPSRSSD